MKLQFLKFAGVLSEKWVKKIDIKDFRVVLDDEKNEVTVVIHSKNREAHEALKRGVETVKSMVSTESRELS